MVADSETKTPTNEDIPLIRDDSTNNLELLRQSVNELQRKQVEIHRQIGQLSSVMTDFEYHMSKIRQMSSSDDKNKNLCQSFLSHLNAVINDTRSALVASTATHQDAEQVQDLVRRLYEENHRIAHHIDDLLQENASQTDEPGEDHVQKAIEQIQLAFEQNVREQERLHFEQKHYETNEKTMETFLHTTEHLHREALEKLRTHVHELREQNQSLRQYNEQIERLAQQYPQTLFLSRE